jgi:hypothetical protein
MVALIKSEKEPGGEMMRAVKIGGKWLVSREQLGFRNETPAAWVKLRLRGKDIQLPVIRGQG